MQEMTGRRPEGGEARERDGDRGTWPGPHPQDSAAGRRRRGVFHGLRIRADTNVLLKRSLRSGAGTFLPSQLARPPPSPPHPHPRLSLLPGPYTCFFPPSSFQEATRFARCRHRKGFPSASDYLWLQLGSRQPSGPGWRLRSLSPLQTALREGGMEGWRAGGEEKRGFPFS